MWTPADIEALPSAQDVDSANKAINELEELLNIAVVEQAKLQVVNLEKDIKAIRAWLAPIRKLPVEILSEIFIHSSRISRFTPVTITEVSRRWRRIVLSTPKAWSFIKLEHLADSNQYLSIFIKRSVPCTLHILPWTIEDYEGYESREDDDEDEHPLFCVVESAAHRISCLCITADIILEQMSDIFTNLTTLTLAYGFGTIDSLAFNRSRFPRLRYLNSDECDWDFSEEEMHLLPPLEYLVTDSQEGAYIQVIKACRATLRGLEIRGLNEEPSAPFSIHFPRLEYLGVSGPSSSRALPFQATSPVLRSYDETGSFEPGRVIPHKDVKNVTHLRSQKLTQLRPFTSLRVLQLWVSGPLLGLVVELQCPSEVCPALESIEFRNRKRLEITEMKRIEQMIKTARPQIEITFSTTWSDLPGSRHEFECNHDT